jgi:phage tail tape-measure protein
LKTSEKYYNAVLVTIKTATTVGLGIAGVEGGMMVGAAGGPFGVVIGGIVGGLLGGAGGNLLNRCVDYFTQF